MQKNSQILTLSSYWQNIVLFVCFVLFCFFACVCVCVCGGVGVCVFCFVLFFNFLSIIEYFRQTASPLQIALQ